MSSADTRCDPARALRHGAVVCRDVSAHDLRSGLGGRNRSQRGIRLHMRSIYADLKLRIRTSARNFVSSRNVRHFPSPKSYAPRSLRRDERMRLSVRGCRRDKRTPLTATFISSVTAYRSAPMYAILSISAAVLIAAYVIMNTVFKIKKS